MKPKSRVKSRSPSPRRVATHHGDRQRPKPSDAIPAQKADAPDITCRDDLPFTARDADDGMIDWQPTRSAPAADHARRTGRAYAEAVTRLADVDEYEAYCAIKRALLSPNWNADGGEEDGFAEGLVRDAIIGMRARASKEALPFVASFDPEHSMWCSLLEQVDVMKAQFKAMKVKPWRTYAEAGLA